MRHKAPPAAIDSAIARLMEAGLLDDQAFASYWVENRELFRPRGTRALRFELQRKGVSGEAVDAAIESIDETESAYHAARERAQRYAKLDYPTFRRRLGGFLQRRGFDYEIVKTTVERLWRELQGVATEE